MRRTQRRRLGFSMDTIYWTVKTTPHWNTPTAPPAPLPLSLQLSRQHAPIAPAAWVLRRLWRQADGRAANHI